jgi:hypothetical protein
VEKEAKQIRKGIKTTYTCNPCSSLELNNGLGSRRTQRKALTQRTAPPPPARDDRGARALVARLLLLLLAALSLSHSLSHSHSLFGWLACVAEIRLTEKVGYSVGLDPIEIGDDPDVQRVVKGLLDASRLPQEKYQEPATSAQEVGWFHEPLVVANPRFVHKIHQAPRMQVLTTAPAPLPHRFVHKIHQGEVTKFAEVYTKKMAGAHMFHGSSGKYLKF